MAAAGDTEASQQLTLEPVAPASPSSHPRKTFRTLYANAPSAPPAPVAAQLTPVSGADVETDRKTEVAELRATLNALQATCGEYTAALKAAEEAFAEQDAALASTQTQLLSLTETMASGGGGSNVTELQTALQAAETAKAEQCKQWEGKSADQDAKVHELESQVVGLEAQLAAKCSELDMAAIKDAALVQELDTDGDNKVSGIEVEQHVREMEDTIAGLEGQVVAAHAVSSTHRTQVTELEVQLAVQRVEFDKVTCTELLPELDTNGDTHVSGIEVEQHVREMEVTIAVLEAQVVETEALSSYRATTSDMLETKVAGLEAQLAAKCSELNMAARKNAALEKVERHFCEMEDKIAELEAQLVAANTENTEMHAALLKTRAQLSSMREAASAGNHLVREAAEAKIAKLEAALAAAAETSTIEKDVTRPKTKGLSSRGVAQIWRLSTGELAAMKEEAASTANHLQEEKITQLEAALVAARTVTTQKDATLTSTQAKLASSREEAASTANHLQAKVAQLQAALAASEAANAAQLQELLSTHTMDKSGSLLRRVQQTNALSTQLIVASPHQPASKRLPPVVSARISSLTYIKARIRELELTGVRIRLPTAAEQELRNLTNQLMRQSKFYRDDMARVHSGFPHGHDRSGGHHYLTTSAPLLAMGPLCDRLVTVGTKMAHATHPWV